MKGLSRETVAKRLEAEDILENMGFDGLQAQASLAKRLMTLVSHAPKTDYQRNLQLQRMALLIPLLKEVTRYQYPQQARMLRSERQRDDDVFLESLVTLVLKYVPETEARQAIVACVQGQLGNALLPEMAGAHAR